MNATTIGVQKLISLASPQPLAPTASGAAWPSYRLPHPLALNRSAGRSGSPTLLTS